MGLKSPYNGLYWKNPKKSQKKTQLGRTNWVFNKIIGYFTYFKLVNGLKWGLLTEKRRKNEQQNPKKR